MPTSSRETVPARRRIIVVLTLVVGAVLLGSAFAQPAGSTRFYLLTLALAAAGTAGGFLSGPIPLGSPKLGPPQRAVALALAAGVAAAGVFLLGAIVVRSVAPLRHLVSDVTTHADRTSFALILLVTVANAAAEEVFFRGAVYAALGHRRGVVTTTAVYVATVAVSGDLALIFAAAVLGLVLAFERQITGGLLGPLVTHVTWSAIMLVALPPLIPH